MSPCAAGWYGLTRRSRNACGSIIGVRLGAICATTGAVHHLPSRLNEDIIHTKQERKEQGQPCRDRKPLSRVVWLGRRTDSQLDEPLSQCLDPLGKKGRKLPGYAPSGLCLDYLPRYGPIGIGSKFWLRVDTQHFHGHLVTNGTGGKVWLDRLLNLKKLMSYLSKGMLSCTH
jgi:hypothetical protein